MPIPIKRIFWPDTHAPYHSNKAVQIAKDIAHDVRPHEIVFLGDFFDCATVSAHKNAEPSKVLRSLSDELQEAQELLFDIVRASGAKHIHFLCGNHEDRVRRYLVNNAGKLASSISIKSIFGIPRYWHFYPYGQKGHHTADGVVCTHGWKSSKWVTASMLEHYRENVLFAHTHRVQMFSTNTFGGDVLTAWNVGWLGDPARAGDYFPSHPNWHHAVTLGYASRGHHSIEIISITKGGATLHGKTIRSR